MSGEEPSFPQEDGHLQAVLEEYLADSPIHFVSIHADRDAFEPTAMVAHDEGEIAGEHIARSRWRSPQDFVTGGLIGQLAPALRRSGWRGLAVFRGVRYTVSITWRIRTGRLRLVPTVKISDPSRSI